MLVFKKVILTSDTHGQHRDLNVPPCDFFIHCGDITNEGEPHIKKDFFKWIANLPARHKIFVAGNHDYDFPEGYVQLENSTHYLNNCGIELEGLKFWGSPTTRVRKLGSRGFARLEADLPAVWDMIPTNTDILITHLPPEGILDLSRSGKTCGCAVLKEKVSQVKPIFHAFGHIHESYGMKEIDDVTYINCAFTNGRFEREDGYMEFYIE